MLSPQSSRDSSQNPSLSSLLHSTYRRTWDTRGSLTPSEARSFNSSLSSSSATATYNSDNQQDILSSEQLEFLVGKEYVQAAIFPDGIDRVSVVSSPVPTLVLSSQPLPTTVPEKVVQQNAEELVLEVVPLEIDNEKYKPGNADTNNYQFIQIQRNASFQDTEPPQEPSGDRYDTNVSSKQTSDNSKSIKEIEMVKTKQSQGEDVKTLSTLR